MSHVAQEDPFYAVAERYIETEPQLRDYIDQVAARSDFATCSVDTEADSMHSYETKLCLIQFSIPDELAIIDPLSIGPEGMRLFPDFIDRFDTLWMHGADYDIAMFDMTFDWVPERILDTQIAARLLGVERFGLGNLLDSEYGVKVSKQSQKADWSRRPLKEKMLAYAYNDVRYLLDLGERYVTRLKELGRHDWFIESCDAAKDAVLERDGKSDDEVWRVSGWGKLSRRSLHYLRSLWRWRDRVCQRRDRPAFKVISNQELLRMAVSLDEKDAANPPPYIRGGDRRRLDAAIEEARLVPEKEYPSKRLLAKGPRLEIDESLFNRLRKFRNRAATDLGIEGTVIATRSVMERLCSRNLSDEERYEGLLTWQREILAPCLSELEI